MRALLQSHPHRAPPFGALLLALGLLSAGCGGSDSPDDPAPDATSTSETSQAPADTPGEEPAADDCSVAVPEMTAATSMLGTVTVTDIAVQGCDLATVTTSLTATADDVVGATGVCSYAANEAAGQGVAETVVVAADGTELARGTTAEDCAGTFTG